MKLIKAGSVPWQQGQGYQKSRLALENELHCTGTLVQLISISPGGYVGPHFHQRGVEAFFVLRGRGVFVIDGRTIEVEPGDLLLCHEREVHDTRAYDPEPLVYVVFKTNWEDTDSVWLAHEAGCAQNPSSTIPPKGSS